MRKVIKKQLKYWQVDIPSIQIDLCSRDEIHHLLLDLRSIYFGAGIGQDFSGFILKSPNAAAMQNITYDPSNVELKVGVDNDGDGYPEDCDDTDILVNPGATEVCGNGIDDDCDGDIDSADSDCGGGGGGGFISTVAR
jgi:hypothetical protein